MARERIMLSVMVDLDPVPGPFHTKESAKQTLEVILLNAIGHYDPVVVTND